MSVAHRFSARLQQTMVIFPRMPARMVRHAAVAATFYDTHAPLRSIAQTKRSVPIPYSRRTGNSKLSKSPVILERKHCKHMHHIVIRQQYASESGPSIAAGPSSPGRVI